MEIREDLKTNPEYLNELIKVLNVSVKDLEAENLKLRNALGSNVQEELIKLQDKVEMLNRRFFAKGKESLNKGRPPKENQKDLQKTWKPQETKV